jgi:predicted nuclease of predicted toxin-antitoxin system
MKFLLDENVEHRIATFLTAAGHDVQIISADYTAGLDDRTVLQRAVAEGRVLITNDRDFGELIFKEQLQHTGVIYFRLPLDTTAAVKIARLQDLLITHQAELGGYIVVQPDSIRIRPTREVEQKHD